MSSKAPGSSDRANKGDKHALGGGEESIRSRLQRFRESYPQNPVVFADAAGIPQYPGE